MKTDNQIYVIALLWVSWA